jgi:hypothetical protein
MEVCILVTSGRQQAAVTSGVSAVLPCTCVVLHLCCVQTAAATSGEQPQQAAVWGVGGSHLAGIGCDGPTGQQLRPVKQA